MQNEAQPVQATESYPLNGKKFSSLMVFIPLNITLPSQQTQFLAQKVTQEKRKSVIIHLSIIIQTIYNSTVPSKLRSQSVLFLSFISLHSDVCSRYSEGMPLFNPSRTLLRNILMMKEREQQLNSLNGRLRLFIIIKTFIGLYLSISADYNIPLSPPQPHTVTNLPRHSMHDRKVHFSRAATELII